MGGSDEKGNLVENDLTFMFLTALKHMKLPDPNGALAVNRKTSRECLQYAVDILGEGITHPAIYNDEAIIKGLCGYGIPLADACNYIHTTCAEISVCAKSRMYTTSITVNMPQVLLDVLSENLPSSFDDIERLYFKKLAEIIDSGNRNYMLKILEARRNGYRPIRASCLVDDCIEKGADVYSGGAKYSYMQPIFIGFANLCDSLYAIKRPVFEEQKLALEHFRKSSKMIIRTTRR